MPSRVNQKKFTMRSSLLCQWDKKKSTHRCRNGFFSELFQLPQIGSRLRQDKKSTSIEFISQHVQFLPTMQNHILPIDYTIITENLSTTWGKKIIWSSSESVKKKWRCREAKKSQKKISKASTTAAKIAQTNY